MSARFGFLPGGALDRRQKEYVLKMSAFNALRSWGWQGELYLEIKTSQSLTVPDMTEKYIWLKDKKKETWFILMQVFNNSEANTVRIINKGGCAGRYSFLQIIRKTHLDLLLKLLAEIASDWSKCCVILDSRCKVYEPFGNPARYTEEFKRYLQVLGLEKEYPDLSVEGDPEALKAYKDLIWGSKKKE